MTPTQFALTLYALCGLSTLGIYAVNVKGPSGWSWLHVYLVMATAIVILWPVPFALALWVAADLRPAGKRWRAP